MKTKITTVEEYFATLPDEAKSVLTELRQVILDAVPGATETISYQMPAVQYHGMVVWYAAFQNHYSIFPYKRVLEVFKDKLTNYELGAGTIRFPMGKPIPKELVTEIINYRVAENLAKLQKKVKK